MDLVYLIGNGFDRNLGLSTDYQSIYKWYIQEESKSPAIAKLKSEIDNNYENWSDLEEGLVSYLNLINSVEEAKDIHKDLLDALQRYIEMLDNNFSPKKDYSLVFLNDLFAPYKSLRKNLQSELRSYIFEKSDNLYLHIISFKYTETIEKLLKYSGQSLRASNLGPYTRNLYEIEHIHGFCNQQKGRMALGLDNENQILNH